MAQLNFNRNQYQGKVNTSPTQSAVEEGWYAMQIVSSEMKIRKGTDNEEMLKLTFKGLSGDFKGHQRDLYLCFNHPNQVVQEIAWGSMAALADATGVMNVQDSTQLHNIPVDGYVKFEAAQEYIDQVTGETKQGRDQNNISGAFKRVGAETGYQGGAETGYQGGMQPPQQPPMQPPQAPVQQAAQQPPMQPQQPPMQPPQQAAMQQPPQGQQAPQQPPMQPTQGQQPPQAPQAGGVQGEMPPWMAQQNKG